MIARWVHPPTLHQPPPARSTLAADAAELDRRHAETVDRQAQIALRAREVEAYMMARAAALLREEGRHDR